MNEDVFQPDTGKHARTEAALRLSEKWLRRVIDASPTAMVMINPAGLMELVNAQAEIVFGYSRDEMLGQPVEMLVPERFGTAHPALRNMFFENPLSRPMGADRDLYAVRKDRSEFPVEIGLNPIETDSGTLVLSAIVDITDRKQRQGRIEAALREKDVLLREIHHRVKNNLQVIDSLLGLQSAMISDPIVQEILREGQNRVRSMALIHQTLYQSNDFAEVDFGHFLESLVRTLASSYGVDADRIALTVDAETITLPIDTAIPCGLAVNEMVSNALKHAFPNQAQGQITITLRMEQPGTMVAVTVADNGVGLPDTFDISTTPTLGLQLVSLLTDQLAGSFSMRRSPATEFLVKFPLTK
ncbi:histidine kinase dimerization/phosphoacceptor domain -containing protein [Emcibacter sp. SYSU 3D8]|uniref:sensor histidine kinase n=1 Tax=Emcibacter sp. SYSU 3D8 TaxID=3133969 RepID=UPI0031FE5922